MDVEAWVFNPDKASASAKTRAYTAPLLTSLELEMESGRISLIFSPASRKHPGMIKFLDDLIKAATELKEWYIGIQ